MKKVLTISALSVALLAGCAANQPVAPQPEPEPIQLVDTSYQNVRISYANEQVATAMKVLNARIVRKGALPKLTFQLVNFSQAKYPIEYKVQWVDEDGMPLMSTAPWLQTTLTGMEAKPIGSIGKSVNAKAAHITIRFPTNVEIYVPTPDPVEKMRIERQVIDEYNARLAAGELKL